MSLADIAQNSMTIMVNSANDIHQSTMFNNGGTWNVTSANEQFDGDSVQHGKDAVFTIQMPLGPTHIPPNARCLCMIQSIQCGFGGNELIMSETADVATSPHDINYIDLESSSITPRQQQIGVSIHGVSVQNVITSGTGNCKKLINTTREKSCNFRNLLNPITVNTSSGNMLDFEYEKVRRSGTNMGSVLDHGVLISNPFGKKLTFEVFDLETGLHVENASGRYYSSPVNYLGVKGATKEWYRVPIDEEDLVIGNHNIHARLKPLFEKVAQNNSITLTLRLLFLDRDIA